MKLHKEAVVIGCFLLWAAVTCLAQEFRSTLMGRVVDAQGGAISGVNITATNVNTSAKFTAVSGHDGLYAVPFLPPGSYRVTMEAAGFSRYQRDGVQISTNQRVPLDITLEVGQITSTVTVTAAARQLQTETASIGQVIASDQIANLPSFSRTPLMLAQISFGVVATAAPALQRPFNANGPSGFSMGGAPTQTNAILLDGAPVNTQIMQAAYSPPIDAVLEVKTESFQSDSASGGTGGGTVNIVLKSGTNGLHGSTYEYNQLSLLAATPFFTNAAGQRKVVSRFNQWGVESNGPVVIPKLFNGRNRLFFLFAYDGIHESLPTPFVETVATPAEKSGNFSALQPSGITIYDPMTDTLVGGQIQRQPFPNNTIPPNRLNTVGLNYMNFYPAPNTPGISTGLNNYTSRTVRTDRYHNELGRLDFNLGERHKLFWDMRHYEYSEHRWDLFDNVATGNTQARHVFGSTLDDVYTFSPTTVLDTRLNWTHYTEELTNRSLGFDMTTIGFPAALAAVASVKILPTIDFGSGLTNSNVAASNGLLQPFGEGNDSNPPFNNYQIFSSLMKVKGHHAIKFGMDLRLSRWNEMTPGYAGGDYTENGGWTRGPFSNSAAAPIGQQWADLLLGLPDGGQFDANAWPALQNAYGGLFLQDDFRVTPTLMLNLGLRYEHEFPTTDRYNRNVRGFDAVSPNPITAQAEAAYARNPIPDLPVSQFNPAGGLLFADASHRDSYSTAWHNFSPRLGFAWSPAFLGGKTVIRGGGGVFFFPLGLVGVNQTGFSQSTSVVSSVDGGVTPYVTLNNPFPQGLQPATGSSLGLGTYLGKSIAYYVPTPPNPYSIRWSLSIQRELTPNLVMEVGYMGDHSLKLPLTRNVDPLPDKYLSTLPSRDQATINRLSALVANPFAGLIPGTNLNSTTVAESSLLTPFPEFTGVSAQGAAVGSSFFHLLQARLERRFSHGLQMQVNYAFSKLLEERDWLNAGDLALEKRPSASDHPQRLVFSATYELPFGKGKRFGSNFGPILDHVAGGWQLTPIYTYQMGAPVAWGNVIYYGGDLDWNEAGVNGAFNTTLFNRNSSQQLANNLRTFATQFGNIRADYINNWDFAIIKDTFIREKLKIQYRSEFFNAMNRVDFDVPNVSPTSSAFGLITNQTNNVRTVQMALRLMW